MATDAEILERYPQLSGFLNHPELGPLLRKAADEGWDTQRLQGGVYDTQWFKSNWANSRQLELLKSTDPAEWQVRTDEAKFNVRSLLSRLGIAWGQHSPGMLDELTTEWMRRGQDDWYLFSEISRRVRDNPALVSGSGSIAAKVSEYREMAANYLLQYDDDALTSMAMREWAQQEDAQAIEQQFRAQAIKRYAHLAEQLERGMTVRQIMQPMVNTVAQTLEMSADQIDLNQGRWQAIVNYQDPNDNKTRTMSISEAERFARQQKEFEFTQTARDESYTMAHDLIREMGAI